MIGWRAFGLAALLSCAAQSSAAQDIRLSQPIDCTLGQDCFIQQYVDHDPSRAAQDYRCSGLTYDDHKGTDFALPSVRAMQAGVDVLAAAPGIVRAVRDGVPDRIYSDANAETVTGRECGNGLRIDHGEGWETQYCHMREGSIGVRPGQRVKVGQKLGQVGLSGRTQFPHLHLTLRHNGEHVDPFTTDGALACQTGGTTRSLWKSPPDYQPGGLISLGFADAVPTFRAIKDGRGSTKALDTRAPALVLWAYAFGGQSGDMLLLRIDGPDGTVIDHKAELEKSQAQLFRAAGLRRPTKGWPQGTYEGQARLVRRGTTIDTRAIRLTLD